MALRNPTSFELALVGCDQCSRKGRKVILANVLENKVSCRVTTRFCADISSAQRSCNCLIHEVRTGPEWYHRPAQTFYVAEVLPSVFSKFFEGDQGRFHATIKIRVNETVSGQHQQRLVPEDEGTRLPWKRLVHLRVPPADAPRRRRTWKTWEEFAEISIYDVFDFFDIRR